MGQLCAMNSIERVMNKHGDELVAELRKIYPSPLIDEIDLYMPDSCMRIGVQVKLNDGTWLPLGIDEYDIDTLGERFPDCEVGY